MSGEKHFLLFDFFSHLAFLLPTKCIFDQQRGSHFLDKFIRRIAAAKPAAKRYGTAHR